MNKNSAKSIRGLIALTSKATGFVTAVGFDEDILIEPQNLNTALHGDEVEISLFPKFEGSRPTGEVIKVLKRAKMEFVGTVDKAKTGGVAFVMPDDPKMYTDIFLPVIQSRKVQHNLKVLVQIKNWRDPKKNPEGVVLKILGKKGNNNTEMESIVLEKGFQTSFPPRVEKDAEQIKKTAKPIPAKEFETRRDFRNTTTFTIDPEDAKDFDDAISFERMESGQFEIGIHIADASHYIKEGSELDKEARLRGTSIYLVDRTIPMLPEILSNDLCSLNANEDKLTFSAVFTIDKNASVTKVWLGRTIINSNKRFTYEEAQKTMDSKKGPFHSELNDLNKLAKLFRDERMKRGAIDFDTEEVKFKLDLKGKPLGVVKKERLDVHKLVEEFMILANIAVATYLSKEIKRINRGLSIYRVHGLPKKVAMDELLFLLRALGHDIEMKGENITSKELNAVLETTRNKPEESLVKTVALRSMAKAVYSTTNIGHYGLALENYTHFTSPIRRYADILVHRILDKHLHGKSLNNNDVAIYHAMAVKLSQREVDAAEAERSSISYKHVEYMLERHKNDPSEIFDGIISGITNWGIFVEEAETKASGMIKFKDMTDDFYVFEKQNYSVVGNENKKRYSIGDKVRIKILGGDLVRKTLDFHLL